MARDLLGESFVGFTGKYNIGPDYDESAYARTVAREKDFKLYELDITAQDFIDNIGNVIYALDAPVAGPGSFSQYMISRLAAQHRNGGPGRTRRRRDLRRLYPVSGGVLRAVHQGRLRGRRKRRLRGHLRVHHPQPHRSSQLQAHAPQLLEQGAVR